MESNITKVETISLALWWGKILRWSLPLIVFGLVAVVFIWLSISIVAAYFYFESCAERNVRGMALVLELVGFTLLLLSQLAVRRAFGMRSFKSQIISYFQSFPRRTIQHVSAVASAHGSSTVFGISRISTWPAPGARVEERLASLESLVRRLDSEVPELRSDIETIRDELAEKIQSEMSKGEVSVSKLKAAAAKGAAGTSWMDFIGLAFFAFGVAIGMFSGEISGYFGFSTTCSF